MDKLRIIGGKPLQGEIRISGAKNAALPLMAASLLADADVTLQNVPHLADIATMANLLMHCGLDISMPASKIETFGHTLSLKPSGHVETDAPYDLVRKMRASVLVLGPLVAKHHKATVSMPGGCAIGARPIDLHLKGLEKLGATISLEEGNVHVHAPKGLKGTDITFPFITVTGTENIMMAATLAQGTTRIINAAKEPEIVDLAKFLRAMGAKISGDGTDIITIEGVKSLGGCTHRIIPDRIETGTYLTAVGITNGDVELIDADLDMLSVVKGELMEAGLSFEKTEKGTRVRRANPGQPLKNLTIKTEPYPGFPTDLQAQFMAMLTLAEGTSTISETIFENRFMHVAELLRMGANIHVHGSSSVITGVEKLKGAPVMATDLRASACLVLAALAAEGESIINRIYHLDRGYEMMEAKLSGCGASIERIP
jgi:UDP-N-acetylglucosamine 1-carboxyvinyltransferase